MTGSGNLFVRKNRYYYFEDTVDDVLSIPIPVRSLWLLPVILIMKITMIITDVSALTSLFLVTGSILWNERRVGRKCTIHTDNKIVFLFLFNLSLNELTRLHNFI